MKRLLVLVAAVALILPLTAVSATSKRSGVLHVTKNCRDYTGAAGSFCTITTSNLNAIKPGTKVVYASAAGVPTAGLLNSDLVLDGPGNNTAYGHVVLHLSTMTGVVTFSGGTGEFSHFHAGPIAVACPVFPDCSWDGPYGFSPPN
jgi:hypothetical protein